MFRINEGQPLTLDSLTITGLDSVADRSAILRNLPLAVGQRFGRLQLANETDSITIRLATHRLSGGDGLSVVRRAQAGASRRGALRGQTGELARFGTIAVRSANGKGGRPRSTAAQCSGCWDSDRAIATAIARSAMLRGTCTIWRVSPRERRARHTVSLTDSIVRFGVDLREDFCRRSPEEGWASLDCFRAGAQYTNKNFLDQAQRFELNTRVSKIGYADGVDFARNGLCRTLNQDSVFSSN
jgi:hypothetical protein